MSGQGGADVRPGPSPGGTFRIDRDGGWRHDGVEVTHPGVLRNLFENLRADGDTHYLAVGPARIPVSVDDAPFVVVRIEADPGTAAVRAHLSDGSVEPLAIESLDVDAQAVPRCRVKGGRFRARLSVAAWLQLTALAEAALESGEPVLRLGERSVPLGGHP